MALSASAQDDVPGPSTSSNTSNTIFTQDPSASDEKGMIDQAFKSSLDSLQHRVVPAPAAKQKSDAKKAQAEEDPLNFNFLQYIIQKFKASELMME
ncbi:MAG: hypothetical protein WDO14_10490 [Bacteroidota bacterium]